MEKDYIEMIIKMENEFKLTVVHFTRPNPMQICACAWIYRWTKKNWKTRTSESPDLHARPPGHRAVGRGPLGGGPAFSKAKRSVIVVVVFMYIFLTNKVIQ